MRKKLALILVIAMVLAVFAGCGSSGNGNGSGGGEESSAAVSFDPAEVKTMGDVFAAADEDNYQDLYTDTTYIYVFYVGDVCYRAVADMPADVSEAVGAIEFDDEDKDQKVRDLVSPLEVARLENLTEQIPSQEELDKLVGKTGQDLFDDGWDYYYYNLDEMEAGLNHGPFAYIVKFAYDGEPMVNSDDFDFYKAFKDLPVTSVTYDGIGDAANMD